MLSLLLSFSSSASVLVQLLGDSGLFLLQVHQLSQGHTDAGCVGDDGDHALGGLLLVAAQTGRAGNGDLAGITQAFEEGNAGGENIGFLGGNGEVCLFGGWDVHLGLGGRGRRSTASMSISTAFSSSGKARSGLVPRARTGA